MRCRGCTGTPSSSVTMTEEPLESERRCLLRKRKSSIVGVVGSWRREGGRKGREECRELKKCTYAITDVVHIKM